MELEPQSGHGGICHQGRARPNHQGIPDDHFLAEIDNGNSNDT
jgi:hypothetical protein